MTTADTCFGPQGLIEGDGKETDEQRKAASARQHERDGVRAPDGAHTSLPARHADTATCESERALAAVRAEVFGREPTRHCDREGTDIETIQHEPATQALSQGSRKPQSETPDDEYELIDLNRAAIHPEYAIHEVDPHDIVIPLEDQEDGVLLSAVARSLDAVGIVIPPMVTRRPDGRFHLLPGQGRTRVLWARDRGVSLIRVVEIKADGLPSWIIMREVAIEDVKRTQDYSRLVEWYDYFQWVIDRLHKDEKQRRKLLADTQRSRTMLLRNSGSPTDRHKNDPNGAESWQKRKFGDPVSENADRPDFVTSERFKYPLTVSLFFREAFSESTARRMLEFRDASRSSDPALKRLDVPKRLAGLGEGEYSADGIERKIQSVKRIETVKRKLREHTNLSEKDIETVIKWIFKRIKAQNLWIWDTVNMGFGTLRRLAQMQEHLQKSVGLTKAEVQAYVFGEYPGADVPLNLMTYLTKPGDLIVDLFAGSGATGDAARHFLDPRWLDDKGRWVWWNHWADEFYEQSQSTNKRNYNLAETVFPPSYWHVDHGRKCLQFDIVPNPVAIQEYGSEFILQHDVTLGITDDVANRVKSISPAGAALVFMDPPYCDQADYTEGPRSVPEPPVLDRDLPALHECRWANDESPTRAARVKVAAKACSNNLCCMNWDRYITVMARLIIECDKILAPDGRIALFMGLDARPGFNFDPAISILGRIQEHYDRMDQVPFELDRTGPLYEKVWVPSHGYGLGPQIARKRTRGQLANVHRHVWILRRREVGSRERLV